MPSDFLKISPRITALPIIHGSGDCALEVRRAMLAQKLDCLALPLPPSFQHDVERAIDHLPSITLVTQAEPLQVSATDWSPDRDADVEDGPDDELPAVSYVPVDPCQPVIAALR